MIDIRVCIPDGPTCPTAHEGPSGPTAHEGPSNPTAHEGPSGPAAHEGPSGPAAHEGPSGPAAHERSSAADKDMFGKCFIVLALTVIQSFSEVEEHWRYDKIRSAYLAVFMQESEEQFYDYRLVTFKTEHLVEFRHDNITQFVQMELDEENNQLLIGSSDYIYRLNLNDLAALQIEKWVAPNDAVSQCHIDQRVKYCSNFIVILKTVQDKVLTCGTLASAPMCLYRNSTDLATIISNIGRCTVCPMSPSYLSTAILTSDQVLYSATFTDKIGLNPMITRISPDPDVKLLLGKTRDSYWFNEPSFIASFELEDYVYFFLQETSVECSNCGKRIVSRMARVCKKDPGANILRPYRLFASFAKARLNCSLPGDVPFYFDQIQSVYLQREEKIFYAIFTAPPMPGSAVCAYNMSAIEMTFGGSFKFRKSIDCNWEKITSSYSKLCGSPEPTSKQINDASDLIFMNDEVQPTLVGPLIVYDYDKWNNIEVDRVTGKNGNITVIFVSSSKGYIKKLMVLPRGNTACLLEYIRLTEEGMPETLLKMKLSKAKSALYVAMETRIIKLPLSRCKRHRTKSACISAQDPYCGWDLGKSMCTSLSESKEDTWEQDITKCPLLELP
ncbi:semaphorin-5A-like isoform X2, partial [Biomphalaria pfeifferi]